MRDRKLVGGRQRSLSFLSFLPCRERPLLAGNLDGSEDHADGNIFSSHGSKRSPVQTIKSYLSHLNPEADSLFQRPKEESLRFNPHKDSVWFEKKVLGHNTLENMLKNMSQRAGIQPYFTNHSLRATTLSHYSVLS